MYHSFYSELRCLSSHGLRIYVILDASRAATLYPLIQAHQDDAYCLFKGELPQTMKAVAPYLIELRHYNHWHQQLLRYVLEHRYGILFVSAWDQSRLERHFRHFSRVKQAKALQQQNPSASPFMFFRYYDPHYLPPLLLHLDSRSQRLFFAPFYALFGADFQGFYQLYLDEQKTLHSIRAKSPYLHRFAYIPKHDHSAPHPLHYFYLTIEHQQMVLLTQMIKQRCIATIAQFLGTHYSGAIKSFDHSALNRTIEQKINKARTYGLNDQQSLALFVTLSLTVFDAFDEYKPIQNILNNSEIQAKKRLSYAIHALPESTWSCVKRLNKHQQVAS